MSWFLMQFGGVILIYTYLHHLRNFAGNADLNMPQGVLIARERDLAGGQPVSSPIKILMGGSGNRNVMNFL